MPDADQARVTRLLEMVSAAVRTYTGQTFDLVEDDEVTLQVTDGRVMLPQRPIVEVSEVTNASGTPIAGVTWRTTNPLRPTVAYGRPWCWPDREVTVTYSHGYATIPADISMVVAERVAAMWSSDPDAGTYESKAETIGNRSTNITYRALAAGVGWHPAHKQTLDAYRGGSVGSTRLR